MTSRRTRVRICRTLCLLVLAVGSVSAWMAGGMIVHNALHGWDKLPQLLASLVTAHAMAKLAVWLDGCGR